MTNAKHNKVTTRVEMIDPAKAQKLLDGAAVNRPLSPKHVHKLVDTIVAGEWQLNGETIKINCADQMEDGQHRCKAIVAAATGVETFVVRGVAVGSGLTMDTGRRRSLSDLLALDGETNYVVLAGAVTWLKVFLHGYPTKVRATPRLPEARRLISEHPELRLSCTVAKRASRVLSVPMGTAMHYLFSRKDPDLAAHFFEMLATGEGGKKNDMAFLLRETLVADRLSARKMNPYNLAWICVKAWNAARAGQTLKFLRPSSPAKSGGQWGHSPRVFPAIE